jgi:prepilin-type processing-associated H-X9-DG protein
MYTFDYDGFIPPDYPGYWADLNMNWPAHLGPYLGLPDDSVHDNLADPYAIIDSGLECPTALPFLESKMATRRPRFSGGYGLNVLLDGNKYNVTQRTAVPPPALDDLNANSTYLADGNIRTPPMPPTWECVGMLYAIDELGDPYHYPDYRHNGYKAVNVVYIGGHVQTVDFNSREDEIRLAP